MCHQPIIYSLCRKKDFELSGQNCNLQPLRFNMKKIYYFLFSLAVLSCSEREDLETVNFAAEKALKVRPVAEAVADLEGFLRSAYPATKSQGSRTFDITGVTAYGAASTALTRSEASSLDMPDTLFYIVNFDGGKGYAVLSALEGNEAPIYAVTESGSISAEDFDNAAQFLGAHPYPGADSTSDGGGSVPPPPGGGDGGSGGGDVPGGGYTPGSGVGGHSGEGDGGQSGGHSGDDVYYEDMGEAIVPALILSQAIRQAGAIEDGGDLGYHGGSSPEVPGGNDSQQPGGGTNPPYAVGPLVKTKWGQGDFFAESMPVNPDGNHYAPGCVTIATAQIIVANKKSYINEFDGVTVSLDTLETVKNLLTPNYEGTVNAKNQVSHFVSGLTGPDYCNVRIYDGSWALASGTVRTFGKIGYSEVHKYTGFGRINQKKAIEQLKAGKPVYLGASNAGSFYGHAWVIDGYMREKKISGEATYFLINWGWNGDNDGYFFFDDYFDPDEQINPGGDSVSEDDTHQHFTWLFRMVTYEL